jgi:hypothetical protein
MPTGTSACCFLATDLVALIRADLVAGLACASGASLRGCLLDSTNFLRSASASSLNLTSLSSDKLSRSRSAAIVSFVSVRLTTQVAPLTKIAPAKYGAGA